MQCIIPSWYSDVEELAVINTLRLWSDDIYRWVISTYRREVIKYCHVAVLEQFERYSVLFCAVIFLFIKSEYRTVEYKNVVSVDWRKPVILFFLLHFVFNNRQKTFRYVDE